MTTTNPATRPDTLAWNPLLLDQLEFHWEHGLRPRFAGLEWNACSVTPSPQSSSNSSAAASIGSARRSTRARRNGQLGRIVWKCGPRNQRRG